MTRSAPWLLLLLLFAAFAGVAVYVLRLRIDSGKDMPRWSVYSEERDGLAEAGRLVRKLGWEPVALTRPMPQLPPVGEPRLLVMVEPEPPPFASGDEADFGKPEVRNLLRWVEQGNTLLLVGRRSNGFHQQLGITMTGDLSAARTEAAREATLADVGGYTEGMERLIVEGRDRVQSAGGLPLWWVQDQPGAVLLRRGRGRVIVAADPALLTRRGLVQADNALFLYNVVRLHAGDGQVYFDEFHHGIRTGGGFWRYLAFHGLEWTLLPVLLVLTVCIWSVTIRLGPAVPPPAEIEADAVNYASALARIYQRAGVRHLLGEGLARQFLTRLTQTLHLRRAAPAVEIVSAWRQHAGHEAKESSERLTVLLQRVTELHGGKPTERELLALTQECDRFLQVGSAVRTKAGSAVPTTAPPK